jgi:hypothetical protein
MNKELKTKMELEVLKVKIGINSQMVEEGVWKKTDSPQMHDYYLNELNQNEKEYLELLREVLIPNQTYVMDMENPIIMYSEEQETIRSIVPFLYEHMIYGQYKHFDDEDYLYDINTPFAKHKYCEGGETMNDNKAEIIECLYVSQWEFNVNPNGVTIITGRPNDEDNTIYVILNKNIFETDLIANISLVSI